MLRRAPGCRGGDCLAEFNFTLASLGLYPIVTLEKQLPNMIGNLV